MNKKTGAKMRLTFLGTGTSHGVPMIGCKCRVCTSSDRRNRRLRTSAIVSIDDKHILIDTTPELRLQCLSNNIERVDAVLFTHAHADHIFGLDDIRRFNDIQDASIPCFGSAETLATIRKTFEYIFVATQEGGGKPRIKLRVVDGTFDAVGVQVTPIPVQHGKIGVLGYRIGDFAYITDCSFVPERSMELLQNLDVLVIGALRHQPHETHFSLSQAISIAEELSPSKTYFVHMSHGLEHVQTSKELPSGIHLAYDGLEVCLDKQMFD